jgi:DNA-binding LytR/AlgR family response regulator
MGVAKFPRYGRAVTSPASALLDILVVDDEAPARDELAYLLREDARIGQVHLASSGAFALRLLEDHVVDAVFCDIKMPGLDGMDLARILARFARRPHVVFVTAYDEHAVDAFAIGAADYLMKPLHPQRVAEAVRRVAEPGGGAQSGDASDESIPVELAGVTRFVRRSAVRYVEAQGDYARLHTAAASHLVRVSLAVLEDRWSAVGFVRIHRSTLVALKHVDELRLTDGHCSVVVGADVLQVSRRHTRELRDRLVSASAAMATPAS